MAARLEASADVTVVLWTILGVVFGVAGGAIAGLAMQSAALGAIGGAIGGGVVGYLVGEHRALEIRFNAQLALCQVAIEENTRAFSGTAKVVESPPAPSLGSAASDAEERNHAVSGPVEPEPHGTERPQYEVAPGDLTLSLEMLTVGRITGKTEWIIRARSVTAGETEIVAGQRYISRSAQLDQQAATEEFRQARLALINYLITVGWQPIMGTESGATAFPVLGRV